MTDRLSSIADIVMGQSPLGEFCNQLADGFPLLNGPTEFGPSHPVATQFTTVPKKFSEVGDLLFCVRGSTTGRMNWSNKRYAIGRGIAAIRHRKDRKLNCLVRAVVEWQLKELLAAATGSTFPNVSGPQLAALVWPSAVNGNEYGIARIISSLDDKIELNRQMNETLGDLAQAVFKDWFIDFGPVRRKLEGATDHVAILGGLIQDPTHAKHTAELFPDGFGGDGLPKEWKFSSLGEVAKNHSETMDLKKRSEVIFVNTGDVLQGEFLHANYLKADNLPGQAKKKIERGDTLYSEIRPKNERYAFVDFNAPDHVVSTKFMVLRAISIVSPVHLYFLVSSADAVGEFNRIAESRSGTFPQITFDSIKHYPVTLATKGVMLAFSEILGVVFKLQQARKKENRTLAETRNYLLPKLMSGEVRVRDAEKIAEDGVAQKAASTTSASVFGSDLFGAPMLTPDQETERDAVLVASVVKLSRAANDNIVVGNVKIQKDVYLIKRFAGLSISTFAKEAAGPYDAALSHEGGKPEAMSKNWIIASNSATRNGKLYEGSAPGAKIAEIDLLIDQYGLKDAVAWAQQNLASKSTDELECLATVDFAMQTLRKKSIIPTLDLIKADIATDPVWKPKLNKSHFCNDAIRKAMVDLDGWFSEVQS